MIPGTHLIPQRELGALHRMNPHQVPCYVIENTPGDVIVFHSHLWHAALNGRDRRQWSVEYFAFPADGCFQHPDQGPGGLFRFLIGACYCGTARRHNELHENVFDVLPHRVR